MPEFPAAPGESARTPEEIARTILSILSPLNPYVQTLPADTFIGPDLCAYLGAQLQQAKMEHEKTENGQKALRIAVRRIEDLLGPLKEQKRGRLTAVLCDMLRILEPESRKLQRYSEWAELERRRPIVTIKGWFEPLDAPYETTYASLSVFLPETMEVKSVTVLKGEEFHNLRFVDVIGKRSGILLEYLPTGETFEVKTRP